MRIGPPSWLLDQIDSKQVFFWARDRQPSRHLLTVTILIFA